MCEGVKVRQRERKRVCECVFVRARLVVDVRHSNIGHLADAGHTTAIIARLHRVAIHHSLLTCLRVWV